MMNNARNSGGVRTEISEWKINRGQMSISIVPSYDDTFFISEIDSVWNISIINSKVASGCLESGIVVSLNQVQLRGSGLIQAEYFECYEAIFFADARLNAMARVHSFELNQLQHTLVNLTGYNISNPAEKISIVRNEFESSTVFVDCANNVQVRFNGFDRSGRTQSGLDLPPVMNFYLNTLETLQARTNRPRERGIIDARGNYWGDPSGPSTCCNPGGQGTPVLWVTDFSNWCLDYGCANLSGPGLITDPSMNESWTSMDSCYYESYCAPQDQTVLWAVVAVEAFSALVGCCVCIYFATRTYVSPMEKWKKMSIGVPYNLYPPVFVYEV